MRHMLNPLDFSLEETESLLELAADIEKDRFRYAHVCDGKKLATLFYEPSTRTRLSFEAAMLNLGGSVLGFSSADSSSASKGESVSDTIRVISCYADICAMRHPKEGAAYVASTKSSIPVINAGDGGHQHPTQTLTDLYTIRSLKGRLSNMTVGLCGDLKFGRTVHSLINALSRYEGIIPAIESSHAVAYAMRRAKEMRQGSILVCLSGRGDKDIDYVVEHYGYGDQFLD